MCKKDVSEHNKCATFCGTPDYLAPEIVRGKLYTFSVDWWSFGVLLFEMIMGNSPYYGRTEEELYRNILEKELKYPSRLDPEARDCLVKLFNRDPTRRLGVISRTLDHKFFQDVLDVKAVCNRLKEPPFVPKRELNGSVNHTAYFDTEFTKTDIKLSRCEKTPRETEQRFFSEFEYINENLVNEYRGKTN
jgi:novel protein kinase C delta type